MGKKKKGSKGSSKKSSDTYSEGPSEPQGPTEQDILTSLLLRLKSTLESTTAVHLAAESRLEELRTLVERLEASGEACARHLRRQKSLQEGASRAERHKLEASREAAELEGRRGEAVLQTVRRNAETERCLFKQEMAHLDDTRHRLKAKHLERETQLPRLRQLEEELQRRQKEECDRSRAADTAEVGRLLRRRTAFLGLVGGLTEEGAEFFRLSLPVVWKRRLAEDVRLRGGVASAAEDVLRLQRRLRDLKAGARDADARQEAYTGVEEEAEELRWAVREGMGRVEEEREELKKLESSLQQQPDFDANLSETLYDTRGAISRIQDELEDVARIREDQSRFRDALRTEITQQRDRNGLLASALLGAAQLARARLAQETALSVPDVDLLRQMAILLEGAYEDE